MNLRLIFRLALLILTLGACVMSLVGYAFGHHALARWTTGDTPPMAVNTALCFLFLVVERIVEITNGGWPFKPAP